MKYLLQAIEAKRASVKLGDAELRDLLTEVCKGRDEREEFLESIDRIITELKNYTEHSTAFLSKVSKRDAPDYYDVIKHPMDLGTMQKKVKSAQYKNKKQFAHDLNLIWDNCLLYNSDPTHPLRRNVQFMRKKANHLLEFISDKSDVKIALGQWGMAPAAANGTDLATVNVSDGTAKEGTSVEEVKQEKSRRKREADLGFGDQEAFVRTPQGMMVWGRIDAGLQQAGPSSRPWEAVEAMERVKVEEEREAGEDVLGCVLKDVFPPLLRGKGKEKATPEPAASARSQSEPLTSSKTTPAASKSTSTSVKSISSFDVSPLDAAADWFTVAASHQLMTGALPALPSSSTLLPTQSEGQDSRGKKRKRPFHLVPATRRKGLQGRIARNVRTLQKVHETHNKFLSLAHYVENEAPIPAFLTSMSSDEDSDYPSDVDSSPPPRSFESVRHPLARISAESARDHASYNVRMMLAHQGFDGGHRVAVDVLTDALGEFIGNMGRLLRIYSDRKASSMSAEEMVLHTLQETGGLDVPTLETYVKNDVERYGSKMSDLLRRLRSSYREQFNMSTERGVIEDEALFADNGEALVAGGFAEGLGDDYFGFRELGLDRELGMAGLTVPTRLFYGKSRNRDAGGMGGKGGVAKENAVPYPPPEEPVPITAAAIGSQIGLLQGWYAEKLKEHRQRVKHSEAQRQEQEQDQEQAEADGEADGADKKLDPVVLANSLPEMEQEKQRYKVPPTGKMPRRLIWSVAAERKMFADREKEKELKAQATLVMNTGGAAVGGGGSSGGGSKTKVKKNAIAA